MYEAGEIEDDYDGFEPIQHIATPMPCAQPFEDPVAKRVATWLDGVDGSPPARTTRTDNLAIGSPMEAFYQLQAQSRSDLDAGIQTPSASSRASSPELKGKHASTIRKLVCVPPLRLRFPSSSSSKLGAQTLATPPRRFKIPARGVSQSEGSALQSRHTSNSSKSRSLATPKGDMTDHLGEEVSAELIDAGLPLPPLSPAVELYRKGKGPKTRRQPSYWDDDLLMQKRIGQEDDDGSCMMEDRER